MKLISYYIIIMLLSFDVKSDDLIHFGHASGTAKLNFVTWNAYKGRNPQWINDLKSLNADYNLLQEAWLSDNGMQTALLSMQNFGTTFATSWIYKGYPTGVATTSSESPISESFYRSKSVEPFTKAPKITLIQTYKNFLLINFYGLTGFSGLQSWEDQVNVIIRELVSTYSGPIVWAGDFNSNNNNRLEYLQTTLMSLGFVHIMFPGDTRVKFNDNVYIRGFKVLDAKVHDEITSSDHSPLTFSLEKK